MAAKNKPSSNNSRNPQLISFPIQINENCRDGRAKAFDECTKQIDLFKEAIIRAEQEGKTLLVSYGAEWCIWCHVFDAYINGNVDKFTYTFGDEGNEKRWIETIYERANRDVLKEANNLKNFVSNNFVLVHIDYEHSPDGDDVLSQSNAWTNYEGSIPYVYTVDKTGNFAAAFNHDDAEIRRDTNGWYRGYDRLKLLQQLKDMRDIAVARNKNIE